MIDIKIPKLAKGGVIPTPIESVGVSPDEYILGLFMTQKEMIEKIEHQKKVIDRLSRRIQNKNKKYKEVIDKAIEYINLIVLGATLNGEPVLFKEETEGQYLLSILKEVE